MLCHHTSTHLLLWWGRAPALQRRQLRREGPICVATRLNGPEVALLQLFACPCHSFSFTIAVEDHTRTCCPPLFPRADRCAARSCAPLDAGRCCSNTRAAPAAAGTVQLTTFTHSTPAHQLDQLGAQAGCRTGCAACTAAVAANAVATGCSSGVCAAVAGARARSCEPRTTTSTSTTTSATSAPSQQPCPPSSGRSTWPRSPVWPRRCRAR